MQQIYTLGILVGIYFGGWGISTKFNMINAFFIKKLYIFLLTTRIKQKENHNNDVYDTKYEQPKSHSSTIKSRAFL